MTRRLDRVRAATTGRIAWWRDTLTEARHLQNVAQVQATDLVLDIGSGSGPHPRANVLCDKFVDDGTERHGHALLVDRPFVVGDVEQLPFKDNAFDFVVCAHVLEHVVDPEKAIRELTRVAKRGYIETPSANWEKVAGFPFHRWLVSLEDGKLIFDGKEQQIWDPQLRRWFGRLNDVKGIGRRIWFARRAAGVYTELVWDGDVAVEVRNSPSAFDTGNDFVGASLDTSDESSATQDGLAARLFALWGRRVRRRSDPLVDLAALVACPICHSALERSGARYTCTGCRSAYPIDASDRPVLLSETRSVLPVA